MKSCLGGACSYPGNFIFSLPRGGSSAASQFYELDFYVTNRFFVTFFTEESNVLPVPPRPFVFPPISKKICVSGWKRRPFAL